MYIYNLNTYMYTLKRQLEMPCYTILVKEDILYEQYCTVVVFTVLL